MSAYIVEDETVSRVVEWLYWEVTKDPFLKEQLENTLKIDTTAEAHPSASGRHSPLWLRDA